MRGARIATVLTLALCVPWLGGCDGVDAGASTPTALSSVSSSPTIPPPTLPPDAAPVLTAADGEPVPVTWVDLASASVVGDVGLAGSSVIPTTTPCRDSPEPSALFDDGAWFAFEIPAATCTYTGEQYLPAAGRVGLLQSGLLHRWRSTSGDVPGDHPRQVVASAVSGQEAVWEETESTDLYVDNWRIFAGSRAGDTHLVATSAEISSHDLGYLPVQLAVDGNDAVWSSAVSGIADDPAQDESYPSQILSKPLDGSGTIVTLATGVDSPVLTDDGLVVRSYQKVTVSSTGSTAGSPTWVPTGLALLRGGSLEPLVHLAVHGRDFAAGESISAVAGAAHQVVFAVGGTTYLLDLSSRTVTGYRSTTGTAPGAHLGDAASSDQQREVTAVAAVATSGTVTAWTFGGGSGKVTAPVFVLAEGVLRRVDVDANFGSVWAAGSFAGWSSLTTGTTTARW